MIFVNILLGIMALILMLGVIGEKDEKKNRNVTLAFVAVCALIFALNRLV